MNQMNDRISFYNDKLTNAINKDKKQTATTKNAVKDFHNMSTEPTEYFDISIGIMV